MSIEPTREPLPAYVLPLGLSGELVLTPCPPAGAALARSMRELCERGVSAVLSLLPDDEAKALGVADEPEVAARFGLVFFSFPIDDRSVPSTPSTIVPLLEQLLDRLRNGENIAVHCRAGIGRTGLVACCVLVWTGCSPVEARDIAANARGLPVPETAEQCAFIEAVADLHARG